MEAHPTKPVVNQRIQPIIDHLPPLGDFVVEVRDEDLVVVPGLPEVLIGLLKQGEDDLEGEVPFAVQLDLSGLADLPELVLPEDEEAGDGLLLDEVHHDLHFSVGGEDAHGVVVGVLKG